MAQFLDEQVISVTASFSSSKLYFQSKAFNSTFRAIVIIVIYILVSINVMYPLNGT
jgi:hypothetical protein